MTKQEKIKEAWGVNYEIVKNYINDKGWCLDKGHKLFDLHKIYDNHKDYDFVFSGEWDDSEVEKYRPKSLSGIENNNGWIKIESEDDLPEKIEGLWEVVINGEQKYIELLKDNKVRLYQEFLRDKITHFKVIEPTKPPIY